MPVRVRVFEDAVDIRSPGGLFGMGETMADRIDLACGLRRLEIPSIPLNFLIPIPGTPLADRPPMTHDEVVRTVAVFRLVNPSACLTGFGFAAILGCGADGLAVRVETTPAAFTVIFAKAAEEEKADIREEVRAEAPDESAAPLAGADQADFETILRERLAEAGSLSVKEITLLAGVSRQTAAKRVKRLVEAGVIEPTEARQNPRQRYRLAAKGRRAKRG